MTLATFATTVLRKVDRRYKQEAERRKELVISREMIDVEIKKIDQFLISMSQSLQQMHDCLFKDQTPVPTRLPGCAPSGTLLKRFAGKNLRTCVKILLSEKQHSIGHLARRINAGGYKGRKATTLTRTRQSLASMLYEDCHSKPTFKNISRGVYALK
jgi:hypothetical protein